MSSGVGFLTQTGWVISVAVAVASGCVTWLTGWIKGRGAAPVTVLRAMGWPPGPAAAGAARAGTAPGPPGGNSRPVLAGSKTTVRLARMRPNPVEGTPAGMTD